MAPAQSPTWRKAYHAQLKKTKLCWFSIKGECKRGQDCTFAHSLSDLKAAPDLYKTSLCPDLQNGRCNREGGCPFAHTTEELRLTRTFTKTKLSKQRRGRAMSLDSDQKHYFFSNESTCSASPVQQPSTEERKDTPASTLLTELAPRTLWKAHMQSTNPDLAVMMQQDEAAQECASRDLVMAVQSTSTDLVTTMQQAPPDIPCISNDLSKAMQSTSTDLVTTMQQAQAEIPCINNDLSKAMQQAQVPCTSQVRPHVLSRGLAKLTCQQASRCNRDSSELLFWFTGQPGVSDPAGLMGGLAMGKALSAQVAKRPSRSGGLMGVSATQPERRPNGMPPCRLTAAARPAPSSTPPPASLPSVAGHGASGADRLASPAEGELDPYDPVYLESPLPDAHGFGESVCYQRPTYLGEQPDLSSPLYVQTTSAQDFQGRVPELRHRAGPGELPARQHGPWQPPGKRPAVAHPTL